MSDKELSSSEDGDDDCGNKNLLVPVSFQIFQKSQILG